MAMGWPLPEGTPSPHITCSIAVDWLLRGEDFSFCGEDIMPLVRAGVIDAHQSHAQPSTPLSLTSEAWFRFYVRRPRNADPGNGLLTLLRASAFRVGSSNFWPELLHPQYVGHMYIIDYCNHCLLMCPSADVVWLLHPFHTPDSKGKIFCRLLELGRTTGYKSLNGLPRVIPGDLLCQEIIERLLIPPWAYEYLRNGASSSRAPRGRNHCLWALDVAIVDQETGEKITRGSSSQAIDVEEMLHAAESGVSKKSKRKSSRTPKPKAKGNKTPKTPKVPAKTPKDGPDAAVQEGLKSRSKTPRAPKGKTPRAKADTPQETPNKPRGKKS